MTTLEFIDLRDLNVRFVKLLRLRAGETRGDHFHVRRVETFWVISGEVALDIRIPHTSCTVVPVATAQLYPGNHITVAPSYHHVLRALTDTVIVEFASNDDADDVYRS